jgi:hypothetical protein
MSESRCNVSLTRRNVLKLGAGGLAGSLVSVRDMATPAIAQTPKRAASFASRASIRRTSIPTRTFTGGRSFTPR